MAKRKVKKVIENIKPEEQALFDKITQETTKTIDPISVPKKMVLPDMGRIRNAKDVAYVEAILKAKKRSPWDAIQLILDAWASKNPSEFRGFVKHIEDTRNDLRDKKFGTTKDGTDMERRLTMVMPEHVHYMIRALFTPQELQMDSEFFREFLSRFPMFRIPEKI